MKGLLGGKGANLAEMFHIGLPVPPGFIISTEACNAYLKAGGGALWPELLHEVRQALARMERDTGRQFGSNDKPLLLSVRSGAVVSMPGMMDTVLNLGLNPSTVEGLARETGNRRFALDCYRRFIQMFADVVLKVDHYRFERILEEARNSRQLRFDSELNEADLDSVILKFMKLVSSETGSDFPADPETQLFLSIRAVFDSWNTQRAAVYRQVHRIPDNLGTAVNIQVMVFGNLGEDSGSGVAFTRDPSTGEARLYGEYLLNAQGEDVVAGIRTPRPLEQFRQDLPEVYRQLKETCDLLEKHYREMQDIEFTIEAGKLYILQTRTGKRTAAAAVKIAVDMVKEGNLTREEALLRVDPAQLEHLLHRRVDPRASLEVIARGLPASPGAASGVIIFDADRAQEAAAAGQKVLLVRPETTPDDIHGIVAAQGVLTSRGGMTSHAAVVARGMGKPCICGCEEIKIDPRSRLFTVQGRTYHEGAFISIDGGAGQVIAGEVPMVDPVLSAEFLELLAWADQTRRLKVRANADNPEDAAKAIELGAEGIGLCRTEHMFMSKERVPVVQKMIISTDIEEREQALAELLPMQKEDFKGILKAMAGLPVTIRLLDPPLHEFLPDREELLLEVDRRRRQESGHDEELRRKELLLQRVSALVEFNPMLGHRGCRLGLVFPEIYRMQLRAIFMAASELLAEGMAEEKLQLEIMIPLVGHLGELLLMRELVESAALEVQEASGVNVKYLVGTMIELPRACLVADRLAAAAEFYSFGTNDLTQTTLGYSRDDAEAKFLPYYLQQKILPVNPFIEIDVDGVGELVSMAVTKGRQARPGLKVGVCGEHGGDPSSVEFFHSIGLDYVSCSPYRIPVARLAAARAALRRQAP